MLNRSRFDGRRLAIGIALLGTIGCWAAPVTAAENVERSWGQTVYVPVYSHIFFGDHGATFNLATTLSIRNADPSTVLSVISADYYDSGGRLLKKYLRAPVVLKPLAATEIFIPESDTSGGFGASFLVRWASEKAVVPPVIECLMIGARSGQGISFVSHGRVVQEAPAGPLMHK
ncbi:MAG: DUF3124 domain-containing protein [Desulfobacterales bacterium]|nr:DUF3124 domain-containing protein [Desulfobacterales bacterium]